jgi:hypothetical protein
MIELVELKADTIATRRPFVKKSDQQSAISFQLLADR